MIKVQMRALFFLQRGLHVAAAVDSARKNQVDSGVAFQNLGLLCWCNAEMNGHRILIFGINLGRPAPFFFLGTDFFILIFGFRVKKQEERTSFQVELLALGGWDAFFY